MIVVYPFYPGDEQLALKNAIWINELGGCKGHEVVCCYDPRCDPAVVEKIGVQMLAAFDKVWRLPASASIDGWPQGANYFFRITASWLQNHPEWPYFLWLEPDAIFLVPGVVDKLVAEHKRAGRPFMGDRVQVKDIPMHMSGVGIYPNPLHAYAGEAYRAHDLAWDMAGKDQIVPNAFFTELIEHAWKHPEFKDQSEVASQIAPGTILFHSSKDGSLIDRLREKKLSGGLTAVQPLAVEARPIADAAQPVCDIFIRTYPGDYPWLEYCMQSIRKYVTGFRKIWIISPQHVPLAFPDAEWKVMNDESPDGYLAQQITKLYADVITDYQPDYILHVDSDVIFNRPTTPWDFFTVDSVPGAPKPIWYYTPYSEITTPWKPITEKFIGKPVDNEFMRRLPMMIPRWLYPKLREFCYNTKGQVISDYVRMQPLRAFSEFNAMGAYAWTYHRDKFAWINTSSVTMPPPFARQFHSWGGITPEIKTEIETILGGTETVHTPKTADKPAASVPSQIKELPSGVWVLEGDQISEWVKQEGRLDHDQNLLPKILPHIKEGDTVVDAGAFIGDHTIAYVRAVGEKGVVHAFEPNPMAYRCLSHNLEGCENVVLHGYGLSDDFGVVPLSGNNGNWGGAYVGDHMKITDVRVRALETEVPWRVNFMKIDVEGYELKVLRGAGNLINRCRPKMVIEINLEALRRQGENPINVFKWLEEHDYEWSIMQENCSMADPLYDILCLPKTRPPETTRDETPLSPAPVAAPPLTMKECVAQLKEFASQGTKERISVIQTLRYAGLTPQQHHKKRK